MPRTHRILALALLLSTFLARDREATAQRAQPKPEFGQDTAARPGFDSKSKVVPADDGGSAALVNRQSSVTDRATSVVYYRYKDVDLPLKKYVEYDGSQPFVSIVDGQSVLWVARRGDVFRVLDKVLYNQLDAMTGAADELYERHRFPSAYKAYKQVYDVITADKNDLSSNDLAHYPAVRSYLLLRMGQSRSWDANVRWHDAADFDLKAVEEDETAAKVERDPPIAHLATVHRKIAAGARQDADAARADAARLSEESARLLEAAANANDRLWQAQNELGILAMEEGHRALSDGKTDDAKKSFERALARFQRARTGPAKEIVDANLVAVHSGLADVAHGRGDYGDALDHVRLAMEMSSDFIAPDDVSREPNFSVAFVGFHPVRGEDIVVTADLASGLARKYLSIERDRRTSGGRPRVAEAESEIPALWMKQGESLLKRKRWGDAVGLYTGLFDAYGLADNAASVSAEFRTHVMKSLEKAFGERGAVLMRRGEKDDALKLLALALEYLPNSRVLNQSLVMQGFQRADDAIAARQWELALMYLGDVEKVYAEYGGPDAEKKKTRAGVSLRQGTAYVGLTQAALDIGDFAHAGQWAEKALHLSPPRIEWRNNKARVLYENGRHAVSVGDKEGAAALFEEARKVAAGMLQLRAHFARDSVRAQLFLPKVKRRVAAATRQFGWIFVTVGAALALGVPAARRSLRNAASRSRAKGLYDKGQQAYVQKSWNEAIDHFNEYIAATANTVEPEAYELLARSYRKIGDFDNALRHFERAAKRLPGRRYNLERAEIYLVRRNLPLALQALRTSPNVNDDGQRLIHFLAVLREKDGESLFLTEALAQIQVTAGDVEAGRQVYLRLLDMEPRNPRALRALSEIARRTGQTHERRRYLEQLISIETADSAAIRELGNLLAAEGELAKAIELLSKAHELSPAEGMAARVAELQAELLVREAESEIQRLQREADTPNRRFHIGELHWRLGRAAEAKPYFEEASNNREFQARALRYLGLIALAEGNPQDAIGLLRGYLAKRANLTPDLAEKEARYSLADAYEKTGQVELAAGQYDAIFEADPAYKDVAKRVRSRLVKTLRRGPVDCPFCRRRVPGEAEFCPYCNYRLVAPANPDEPIRTEKTGLIDLSNETTVVPGGALPGKVPTDDDGGTDGGQGPL